ncbi:MAG TPA: phosphoribosyltransferase family protein [Candidatus Saccharimonas sp.]|nr:phosphoribosyltransferase family protein [Candidatus Saccharimonas sp.]
MRYVWPAALYEGNFERVIHLLKFERSRAAHIPLAAAMQAALPYDDWLVVPLPTASRRMRQRGYDQAVLLAQAIAKARGLPTRLVLERVQSTRQLGSNRVQRQKQSTKMFCMMPRANVQGTKILLVDDVCTTGATLTAAARLLKQAGAAQIDAVVAAWQPPKS